VEALLKKTQAKWYLQMFSRMEHLYFKGMIALPSIMFYCSHANVVFFNLGIISVNYTYHRTYRTVDLYFPY